MSAGERLEKLDRIEITVLGNNCIEVAFTINIIATALEGEREVNGKLLSWSLVTSLIADSADGVEALETPKRFAEILSAIYCDATSLTVP